MERVVILSFDLGKDVLSPEIPGVDEIEISFKNVNPVGYGMGQPLFPSSE